MKTAVIIDRPALTDAQTNAALADAVRKLAAYTALAKPRIVVLVLVTVAVGFLVGGRTTWSNADPLLLPLTLLGTALVAGGASAWNQYLERASDRRMKRTADRPLPSRRLAPIEAAVSGAVLGTLGAAILAWGVNSVAATLAVTTFVLYVFVYTPLKPRTTLNTAVGAVPGALPPLIGWVAATGRLDLEAWSLFLIVYLWQFPHFLAIAWIYRDDYARAGHKMLPTVDPRGAITGRQAASYALALIPAGLLPATAGLAGPFYFLGALALGVAYFVFAVRFWIGVSEPTARSLLRVSLVYLPAILLLLLLNPMPA